MSLIRLTTDYLRSLQTSEALGLIRHTNVILLPSNFPR